MFLVIDNYDSFVHNLARYFEIAGAKTRIVRNDGIDIETLRALAPQALVLSPGPCTPREAGICIEAIKALGETIPVLGVCLGHQCIGEAYGHETARAKIPMHGKASLIRHEGTELFDGLPAPFFAGRYHSLIVREQDSSPLKITARNDEGEIMALSHPAHPVHGVQFHPESVLTPGGQTVVENFVKIARSWNAARGSKAA
jgi:para-aminobenzoate synthetase component II